MLRVWAIALNTFREAVRDRVLYGLVGFASAVVLFALALAELALDQQARVIRDVGLAAISLFSVVIAVFLGSSLLYKEIERRTLYVILPKPIRRHEFLLGKYFGIVLVAVAFLAIMGILQLFVTDLQAASPAFTLLVVPVSLAVLGGVMFRATDKTAVLLPWALVSLAAAAGVHVLGGHDPSVVLFQLLLSLGEVALLSAVAMLFSSFSTPFLTGVFTVGVWLVGRSAEEMATMRSRLLPDAIKSFLHGLAWVFPNFHLFVPHPRALAETLPEFGSPTSYVATTLGYASVYAAILLIASAFIFRRRDFV